MLNAKLGERENRIVSTAVELAREGGFEAVRLRDVAANSGVALGTLYRHFRSKEDLLVAALGRETEALLRRAAVRPIEGDSALERLVAHFHMVTRALCRKPKFARAVLRSATSAEPQLAGKMSRFHDVLKGLVVAALRGTSLADLDRSPATELEQTIADVLQQVWFAALVGWGGGLHGQAAVAEKVGTAAELLLRGAGIPE